MSREWALQFSLVTTTKSKKDFSWRLGAISKPGSLPTPTIQQIQKQKGLKKWRNWWSSFDTFMSRYWGAAEIPLQYVYRGVPDVDTAALAVAYNDHEDCYYQCVEYCRAHYQDNNKRVSTILKASTLEGQFGGSFDSKTEPPIVVQRFLLLSSKTRAVQHLQTKKRKLTI